MEGCSEKFTKFTYCSNGEILLVSMCTKKIWKKKIVLSAMHSIVKATEVELKKSIIHESYLQ